jgi:hypothetical protein
MAELNAEALARALETLARDIERHAGTVIGSSVSVGAQAGFKGTLIGEQISVTAGPGSGNIVGRRIEVSVTGNEAAMDASVARQILDLASSVRSERVPSPRIHAVLNAAGRLGNAALTEITRAAVRSALQHDGV